MAKRKTTTDTISNPLSGSAFFKEKEPSRKRPQDNKPNEIINRTEKQTDTANTKETRGRPPSERETTRHSFEFYVDQVTKIRRIKALKELDEDRTISLSEIVRDALDEYIERHK